MSKATAATVVAKFEELSGALGYTPEEMLEVVEGEYAEETPEEAADAVIDSVDTPEEETCETEPESELSDGEVECGECGEVFDSDSGFYGHINGCEAGSDDMVNPEDTEDTEDTEKTEYHIPYDNDLEGYDNPQPNMSIEEIKSHPKFEDISKDAEALQHHQLKNGVCEECEIAYAGKGDVCHKCDAEDRSGGSSEEGLTVAKVESTFGVTPQKAREAIEDYENGLFGSVKAALEG
jgi:hypothetical protein